VGKGAHTAFASTEQFKLVYIFLHGCWASVHFVWYRMVILQPPWVLRWHRRVDRHLALSRSRGRLAGFVIERHRRYGRFVRCRIHYYHMRDDARAHRARCQAARMRAPSPASTATTMPSSSSSSSSTSTSSSTNGSGLAY
jgi:hypothetical protein